MTRIQFKTWLSEQLFRDDPVGDVARDVRDDPCSPRGHRRIRQHMIAAHRACDAAVEAFDEAVAQWQDGHPWPPPR